jgi:hypothetical protein
VPALRTMLTRGVSRETRGASVTAVTGVRRAIDSAACGTKEGFVRALHADRALFDTRFSISGREDLALLACTCSMAKSPAPSTAR